MRLVPRMLPINHHSSRPVKNTPRYSLIVLIVTAALTACMLRSGPAAAPATPGVVSMPTTPGPTQVGAQTDTPTPAPFQTPTSTQIASPTASPDPAVTPTQPTSEIALVGSWGKGIVDHLAWTPDGTRVIAAGALGVYVYDAATMQQQEFLDTGVWIRRVAVSPDGYTLAAADTPGAVQFWDLRTGRRLTTIQIANREQEGSMVTALAFSPDGRTLAWGGSSGHMRLWDLAAGRHLHSFQDDTALGAANVQTVAFSPDGRLIAADTVNGMWVRDVVTGTVLHRLEDPEEPLTIRSIAFSADSLVLVGATGNAVTIWDVETGEHRRTQSVGSYAAVALAPNLSRVALARDGAIQLRNPVSGARRLALTGHTGYATSLAFSPGGSRLAAVDGNAVIWLWDTQTGRVLGTAEGHAPWVGHPAFRPDGVSLAWPGGHRVWLWDVSGAAPPRAIFDHPGFVREIAFSPEGRTLATAGGDSTVRVWDMQRERLVRSLEAGAGEVFAVSFSPDGRILAAGGDDGVIRLWDTNNGRLQHELAGYHTPVHSLAFSPDGQRLASAAAAQDDCFEGCAREEPEPLRLWAVETGELIAVLGGNETDCATTFIFSPAGDRLAAGLCDAIGLWDSQTGERVHSLTGANGQYARPVFSPDGGLLAAVDEGAIHLWDLQTGNARQPIDAGQVQVIGLAFSVDGRLLASAGFDGTIQLWQIER